MRMLLTLEVSHVYCFLLQSSRCNTAAGRRRDSVSEDGTAMNESRQAGWYWNDDEVGDQFSRRK